MSLEPDGAFRSQALFMSNDLSIRKPSRRADRIVGIHERRVLGNIVIVLGLDSIRVVS